MTKGNRIIYNLTNSKIYLFLFGFLAFGVFFRLPSFAPYNYFTAIVMLFSEGIFQTVFLIPTFGVIAMVFFKSVKREELILKFSNKKEYIKFIFFNYLKLFTVYYIFFLIFIIIINNIFSIGGAEITKDFFNDYNINILISLIFKNYTSLLLLGYIAIFLNYLTNIRIIPVVYIILYSMTNFFSEFFLRKDAITNYLLPCVYNRNFDIFTSALKEGLIANLIVIILIIFIYFLYIRILPKLDILGEQS